eukprot:NODE_79_length_22985_cov_0.358401.p7 type:complete len:256 gc:universal NODE_79_length_22985_cov_0.358401:1342-575(-)
MVILQISILVVAQYYSFSEGSLSYKCDASRLDLDENYLTYAATYINFNSKNLFVVPYMNLENRYIEPGQSVATLLTDVLDCIEGIKDIERVVLPINVNITPEKPRNVLILIAVNKELIQVSVYYHFDGILPPEHDFFTNIQSWVSEFYNDNQGKTNIIQHPIYIENPINMNTYAIILEKMSRRIFEINPINSVSEFCQSKMHLYFHSLKPILSSLNHIASTAINPDIDDRDTLIDSVMKKASIGLVLIKSTESLK